APNSGHMVHMPGHIYWRVGDYERARQSFVNSVHVDEAYMAAQGIKPEEDWNYAHNLAYLIAACAESGRYHEGLEWAKKLRDMPAPTGMSSARFVVWSGASVARVHIRFGDWKAVPGDPVSFGADAASAGTTAKAYSEGLNLYAMGMAALEGGNMAEASKQAEALDALLWRLEAGKPKKKASDAAQDHEAEDPSEILNLLGTISLDLRGDLKIAQGDPAEGIQLLEQAAEKEKGLGYTEPPHYYRPEQESLGYAYLKSQQWEKAREAFQASLRERPKNGHGLYGLAQSYALAGDATRATAAYQDFLASWPHADSDLPQVKQAMAWLAASEHRSRQICRANAFERTSCQRNRPRSTRGAGPAAPPRSRRGMTIPWTWPPNRNKTSGSYCRAACGRCWRSIFRRPRRHSRRGRSFADPDS